jgi:beta-lactamase regulating signal transducer with metallopeptidase domain
MVAVLMERTASTLADAALKSFFIFAVARLIVAIWRKSSASSRHLVWTSAACASIALPMLGALLPEWKSPAVAVPQPVAFFAPTAAAPESAAPVFTTPIRPAPVEQGPEQSYPVQMKAAQPKVEPIAAAQSSFGSRLISLVQPVVDRGAMTVATFLWFAGFVVVLLPFCVGRLRLLAIASAARPVTDGRWEEILARIRATGGFARRVTLLESDDAAMPMTWGVISPVLLLPAGTSEWPEWKCRNILLHELAHIERFDCLTQLVARVACAIYWFNPLAWTAAGRMQAEREMACDDRVIRTGSRPSEYAGQLLDVARSLRPARATAHAAIAMARPSQLSGRLTAVLDKERNRDSVSARLRLAAGAATFGFLVPVASFSPWIDAAVAAPVRHAASSVAAMSPQTLTNAVTSLASALPIIKAVQSSDATLGVSEAVGEAVPHVGQSLSCWEANNDHSSVNIDDDDSRGKRTTVKFSSGDCSLELRANGAFTLRPDLSDVATLERGGSLTVEERDGRTSRRVEVRSNGAELERIYYVNGQRTDWSPEARAWLANILLAVERRTAFAAATRVPQLFASRGASGVLQEVSLMPSDYAKSAYLGVLLKQEDNLDAGTLTRIVQQATREMKSDYYLAEVFTKVGSQRRADEGTWRAFADAASELKSDYYKAQVIGQVLGRDQLDAGTISTLLKATATIKSDYYQAEILKSMSRRYVVTPQTRPYYLAALNRISSDYYRAEVLSLLNTGEPLDAGTTSATLKSIGDMKSDYYKSEALSKLAKRGTLDQSTRRDYFSAIRSIDSDYYKHAALEAALSEKPLSRETVAGVLSVAPMIKSDYELSALLASVSRAYPIDDSLRPAYDRAVDAIESDYYRGVALSAARPRSTSR